MDSQFLSCAKMLCVFAPSSYTTARVAQRAITFATPLLLRWCAKSCKSRQATSAVLCLKGEVNHPDAGGLFRILVRARRRRDYLSRRRQLFKFIVTTLGPLMGNMEKFQKHTRASCFFVPAQILMFVCVSEKQQKTKQKTDAWNQSAFLSDFLQDRESGAAFLLASAPDTRLSISFFSGERDFPSGRHWATGRTPRERSDGIVWKFKKSPVSPGGDVTAFINLCAVSATFVYIFGIRRTRSKIVTHHLHLFFMLRPTHSAGSVRAYHTLRMTVVRSLTPGEMPCCDVIFNSCAQ
jgi:hypothetical protein